MLLLLWAPHLPCPCMMVSLFRIHICTTSLWGLYSIVPSPDLTSVFLSTRSANSCILRPQLIGKLLRGFFAISRVQFLMAFLFNRLLISLSLVILMLIGLTIRMIEKVQVTTIVSLALIWFHGLILNKKLFLIQVLSPNTEALLMSLQNFFGLKHFSLNYTFCSSLPQSSFVTISVLHILLLIPFCMLIQSTLKLIIISFVIVCSINPYWSNLHLLKSNLQTSWPSRCLHLAFKVYETSWLCFTTFSVCEGMLNTAISYVISYAQL